MSRTRAKKNKKKPSPNPLPPEAAPHDDTFLGLPFNIWARIFRYAGVLCDCAVTFKWSTTHNELVSIMMKDYTPKGSNTTTARDSFYFSRCPEILRMAGKDDCIHTTFITMLRVCHKAKYMTLKATLREASCHLKVEIMKDFQYFKEFLQGLNGMAPLILKRLHVYLDTDDRTQGAFFKYFSNNLKGNLTHISVECRLYNREGARKTVERISRPLGTFNGCKNIRFILNHDWCGLGSETRRILWENAAKIASQSIAHDYRKGAFRFMDLPVEIQEMILQELLVVVDGEIFRDEHSWTAVLDASEASKTGHTCIMCSVLHRQPIPFINVKYFDLYNRQSDTFRNLHHTDSLFSFTSPLPILLTNKHLYEIGSRIFFSQNKFRVHVNHFLKARPGGPRRRFTYGFPTRHIHRIRRLRIPFSLLFSPHTVNSYSRFAAIIRKEFHLKTLDMTPSAWSGIRYRYRSWDASQDEALAKALAFFDDFEGERPEWYQRANQLQQSLPQEGTQDGPIWV